MFESVTCKSLHDQCLRALKTIILICPTQDFDPNDIFSLKESWYRLMLWDEPFHEQNLDETMDRMPILRDTAIQFLCEVARLLLESKLLPRAHMWDQSLISSLLDIIPFLSVDPASTHGADLAAVAETLEIDLNASKIPSDIYQKFNEHKSDSNGDLEGGVSHDHLTTVTLTITAQDIGFYVSCLLGLQHAMESLSTFHLSGKEYVTEVQDDMVPEIIVSKAVDESLPIHIPTIAGFPTPPPRYVSDTSGCHYDFSVLTSE
jgi:hypothetical protein